MTNSILKSSHTAAQGRGVCVSTQAKPHQVLQLAIDAHAHLWVTRLKVDNSLPEAIRQFTDRQKLLEHVRQCVQKAQVMYSVYEAGATGYDLHRELLALGVKSLVMAAEKLDDQRKTDRIDVAELLNRLDRYVGGNTRAFTSIRVPTLSEEMRRQRSRMRDDMQKALQAMNARGRSLALLHGMCLSGRWWGRGEMRIIRQWAREKFHQAGREVTASFLRCMHGYALECRRLEPMVHKLGIQLAEEYQRRRASAAEAERLARNGGIAPQLTGRRETAKTTQVTRARQEQTQAALPIYFGAMTAQILDAEICNWERFNNVRQVGGFFGLAPGVCGSGGKFVYGPITKHGNPRLRVLLIELAWRMVRYQRGYWAVRKWWDSLQGSKPKRKKAIVAVARCLAVDIWRWKTGRLRQLEDLGFVLHADLKAA